MRCLAPVSVLLCALVLGPAPEAAAQSHPGPVDAALERAATDRAGALRELELIAGREPGALLERLEGAGPIGPDGLPAGPHADLLATALAGLPHGSLVALMAVEAPKPLAGRRARLAVLARTRTGAALDLALELVRQAEQPLDLSQALETTATALHRERDDVGDLLAARAANAELTVVEPLVRALAAVDRPATPERLARLLGRHQGLDPYLLGVVGELTARRRDRPDPILQEDVRRALHSEHDATRREAIVAAVRLWDYDACPRLIELLDDAHSGVRENARWGLERLSNLALGSDPLRWRTWHTLNETWWLEEWPDLAAALEFGSHQETVRALREVAGRTFHRIEVARQTARVLDRTDEPALLAYACLALSTLETPTVAEAVLPLLDDPRPGVWQAAHRCLRASTGLELEPDFALWSDVLSAHDAAR